MGLRPASRFLLGLGFCVSLLVAAPSGVRAEEGEERDSLFVEAAYSPADERRCDAINDRYPNGVPAEACSQVPGCRINGGRGHKHICVYDPNTR